MTIPDSRNTTYAALAQVKSADLNDLQDRIIEIFGRGFADRIRMRRDLLWDSGVGLTAGSATTTIAPGFELSAEVNASFDTLPPANHGMGGSVAAQMRVELASTASEGAQLRSKGTTSLQAVTADDVVVMDWCSELSHVGSNSVDVYMGMFASLGNPTGSNRASFRKQAGDTNWQCYSKGSTTDTTDSGVAPVANTPQRFRIEFHGANTPLGVANSNPTIRYYIDGSLVHTLISSTATPQNSTTSLDVGWRIDASGSGTSVDTDLRVGPARIFTENENW